MESLIYIAVLGGIIFLWLDGARAREIAIGISQSVCDKHHFQLLDQSVARQRFGLRWGDEGIRFRRMFQFEYSDIGDERKIGYVILIGHRLEYIEVPGLEKVV